MNLQKSVYQILYVTLIASLLVGCNGATNPIRPAVGMFATNSVSPYILIFVVEESNQHQIGGFIALCGDSLPNAPGLTKLAININNSKFTIENQDIRLSAEIIDSVSISGTIEAKSPAADKCGIPKSAKWTATCGSLTGLNMLVIEGKVFSTNSGDCK